MTFASLTYLVFLPLVFTVYWSSQREKPNFQNLVLVIASAIFYGWWDWRFLSLLSISTLSDYIIGTKIADRTNKVSRKRLLTLSILINIGILGFFKYANFFIDSFNNLFDIQSSQWSSLNIILPVGISFYTFQTLSYTIDIYRNKLKPTKSLLEFATFVSFFPQLVAGPIERASKLLPQFKSARSFNYSIASQGARQILWGFFIKLVIADNCAIIANQTFAENTDANGLMLWTGLIAFAMQIYGDFSGYSHIALGTAKLFGIELSQNFSTPYFSTSIAEFWRRWHISLSTWFKDYLYIPLGGSRTSRIGLIRNIWIVFLVSGLWHGAAWTFVIWGALHALYMTPKALGLFKNVNKSSWFVRNTSGPTTFLLTLIAWIFFRSTSVQDGIEYLTRLLTAPYTQLPNPTNFSQLATTMLLILIFMFIEWNTRHQPYALAGLRSTNSTVLRWSIYAALLITTGLFMQPSGSSFIYFQF